MSLPLWLLASMVVFPQERHVRVNRQIWQYGAWVGVQARVHDLPVLDPLPFSTLTDRARAALTR